LNDQREQLVLGRSVRLCQEGNRDEFKAIVDAYSQRLYRIAWLITRDHGLAEDAIQETFIRGWQQIRSLSDPSKLTAWLTRIIINYLKNQRRRNTVPTAKIEAAVNVADPARADQQTLAAETASEMSLVIAGLPTDQRTVLVLRYFEELSLEEIVEATGWRLGRVKSRIHRALRHARREMERLGPSIPNPQVKIEKEASNG
jgi:RNA polymerase sigma-70 factor (ECF subfamily)